MNPISVMIHSRTGSEDALVTPLGDDCYRIESIPTLLPSTVNAIVRLRPLPNGEYKLVRVLERGFNNEGVLVPRDFATSNALYAFGEWIEERGGQWECLAEGFLRVFFPANHSIDWVTELNRRLELMRSR